MVYNSTAVARTRYRLLITAFERESKGAARNATQTAFVIDSCDAPRLEQLIVSIDTRYWFLYLLRTQR